METTFDLIGTRCRIEGNDPVSWTRLTTLLAPFGSPGTYADDASPHFRLERLADNDLVVFRDEEEVYRNQTTPALSYLLAQLTASAIEHFEGFAVHAGVVAIDGRAIVIPAASGTGKTTLTAACLHAGFDYLSDEALCVLARFAPRRALPEATRNLGCIR